MRASAKPVFLAALIALLSQLPRGSQAQGVPALIAGQVEAGPKQVVIEPIAVTFGDAGSRHLFSALVALPFVLLPAMAWFTGSPALMLPVLLAPMALDLRHRFLRCPPGTAFNDVLFRTFRLELWFAALLSAGAVLARWVG